MTENHLVVPFADDDTIILCDECGEQEAGPTGYCWECYRDALREIKHSVDALGEYTMLKRQAS